MDTALVVVGVMALGCLALAGFVCWRSSRRGADVAALWMLQDMISWATTPVPNQHQVPLHREPMPEPPPEAAMPMDESQEVGQFGVD